MPTAPTKAGPTPAGDAAPSLTDALAHAGWVEADLALAEAIVEFDALQAASNVAQRKLAIQLLGQALRRAARRRGLMWKPGQGVLRGEVLLAPPRPVGRARDGK